MRRSPGRSSGLSERLDEREYVEARRRVMAWFRDQVLMRLKPVQPGERSDRKTVWGSPDLSKKAKLK